MGCGAYLIMCYRTHTWMLTRQLSPHTYPCLQSNRCRGAPVVTDPDTFAAVNLVRHWIIWVSTRLCILIHSAGARARRGDKWVARSNTGGLMR